jgi:hypothetical protein
VAAMDGLRIDTVRIETLQSQAQPTTPALS